MQVCIDNILIIFYSFASFVAYRANVRKLYKRGFFTNTRIVLSIAIFVIPNNVCASERWHT